MQIVQTSDPRVRGVVVVCSNGHQCHAKYDSGFQSLQADGTTYLPPAAKFLQDAGWVQTDGRWYCGKHCQARGEAYLLQVSGAQNAQAAAAAAAPAAAPKRVTKK